MIRIKVSAALMELIPPFFMLRQTPPWHRPPPPNSRLTGFLENRLPALTSQTGPRRKWRDSSPSGTASDSGAGGVTRGGFGAFARAFTSHFSGGG
jgi:hypothetical protein